MTIKEFNDLRDLVKVTCIDLFYESLQFDYIYGDFQNQTITVYFSEEKKTYPGILRKLFDKPIITFIPYKMNLNVDAIVEQKNSAKLFLNYLRKKIEKTLVEEQK